MGFQQAYFKCAYECFDRRRKQDEISNCVEHCNVPVLTAQNLVQNEMAKFQVIFTLPGSFSRNLMGDLRIYGVLQSEYLLLLGRILVIFNAFGVELYLVVFINLSLCWLIFMILYYYILMYSKLICYRNLMN